MTETKIKDLRKIFELYPQIKLVYIFGSKARGDSGVLSDYDFAFYIDEKDKNKIFDLRLKLLSALSRELNTDRIDVVVLNTAEKPELKYNIIKEGKLIYEKEPYRVLVEPRILNEYFDFHSLLVRHGLTKSL